MLDSSTFQKEVKDVAELLFKLVFNFNCFIL